MTDLALVLSGGGSKGAHQAGALFNLYVERGFSYDTIAGTSVGALNGAFLAMFPRGQEFQAAEELRKLWMDISDAKVWGHWPLRRFWKRPSVFHTKPLQKLVESRLDPARLRSSGRKLRIGAVSLETGRRRVFTEQDPQIVRAVLASSAYPLMFQPIEIDGELYTDDGVRENTPAKTAIDEGAKHLHVLHCGRPGVGGKLGKPTLPNIAKRTVEIMGDEISEGDIDKVELYSELVRLGSPLARGKRVIGMDRLHPSRTLAGNGPLDFGTQAARSNWTLGLEDARAATWRRP